jgi:voltage-gated potassium channel
VITQRVVADTSDELDQEPLETVFYPEGRIPLVEWDSVSGAKPTVVVTGVVTMLAFVTGLSNLSRATVVLNGPLATLLPAAGAFARFGGVLFAFALGPVTVGLRRRKRLAWQAAVVAMAGLTLLPLTTFAATDVPLFAAGFVTLPLLVRNRGSFDQAIDLSPLQVASLSAILGVLLYGTMGAYGLRDQFLELDSWVDAVYYVVVTIATVGYGDITPATPLARWFSLSVILFGTGAFTVAVGALIGPAIESRMAAAFGNMTASELTLLEDHVAVLGYDDLTEPLFDHLDDDADRVVVTPDADTAARLESEDVNVLTGDPTDEAVLRDARVDAAKGVAVGSGDDARDVLAVLAVRNVAPEVRVVAAATEGRNVEKFRDVGADEVINLRKLGGRLLGASVVDGTSPEEFLGTDRTDEETGTTDGDRSAR